MNNELVKMRNGGITREISPREVETFKKAGYAIIEEPVEIPALEEQEQPIEEPVELEAVEIPVELKPKKAGK